MTTNSVQETVQFAQCLCDDVRLAQSLLDCHRKLVEVEYLEIAVGVDDHIGEEISDNQRILGFAVGIVHNITVPVQERELSSR